MEKEKALADFNRTDKSKRILEVGTLIGYSTNLMGKGVDGDANLNSIEIYNNETKMAEENIKRAKIPPTIEVIVGDAE